jgi:NADH:flavin oxidoreductase / NADH oxidase family
MTTDPIFHPVSVGSLDLPNRVVMTTVKLGYGTPVGEVTDRHIAFHSRRATGGVGLLTTEPWSATPSIRGERAKPSGRGSRWRSDSDHLRLVKLRLYGLNRTDRRTSCAGLSQRSPSAIPGLPPPDSRTPERTA